MPIYEFRCAACDHLAELLLGLNDPAPQFCPSCGAEGTMRKAFAPPAIHFKGSGWAKKERRSASASPSSTKAASKAEDGDGSSSSAPSDAKKDGDKAASSASKDTGSSGSSAD